MEDMFLYTIKSAIVLALLYVPYTLVLSSEKFFRLNRMALICFMMLSLVVPLLNVACLSADNQPVVHVVQQQMIEIGIPVRQAVADYAPAEEEAATVSLSWFQIVSVVYILGMAMVLLVRIVQFCRMGMLIRRKCLWKDTSDGITIYCRAGDVAPFSWFRNIVISEEDYRCNGREIILHEQGHILLCHSYDIVLLTVVQMIQWWNPLVYMFGNSLRNVHEYEADDYVLRQGVSLRGYQMLLVKKAVGSSCYALANNFNHSLIRNRITMMCKKKTNPWMRCKVLYVIPMVALSLSVFATPEFTATLETAVCKAVNNVSYYRPAMVLKSDTPAKKLIEYVIDKKKGKTQREIYRVCFPKGTWIDNGNDSHLEEIYTFWAFEKETLIQVDGVAYDKDNLPDLPPTAAKKIEIRETGGRQTVNIITKNVVVPSWVKDNIPRQQTILLSGNNSIGIVNRKAVPGDWVHCSVSDWEPTAWNYSVRNEFEHSKTKPDLTVYIYASTEATKGEINRAIGILKELGISNYKVTENIPITHWTDSQYRDWAMRQKQLHPEYDWQYLFDAIATEGIDGGDFKAKWHIVKEVYGVK